MYNIYTFVAYKAMIPMFDTKRKRSQRSPFKWEIYKIYPKKETVKKPFSDDFSGRTNEKQWRRTEIQRWTNKCTLQSLNGITLYNSFINAIGANSKLIKMDLFDILWCCCCCYLRVFVFGIAIVNFSKHYMYIQSFPNKIHRLIDETRLSWWRRWFENLFEEHS